jgi:hypothetical protein
MNEMSTDALNNVNSAVPAQLGLKARAFARLLGALAFETHKPG